MRGGTLAVLVCSVVAATACGDDDPGPVPLTHRAHGLAVELPPGWHVAGESLTPNLSDPREVLAVSTVPLHPRPTGCAQVGGSALQDMGPRGAFVTLQERGLEPGSAWLGFPARPAHFGPELGGPSEASECVPTAHFTDHWFGFTDEGRHFHVLVAFGPLATAETRRQAWAILDTVRVDPLVRPDWESAG
jgi:hypothetical protein